MEDLVGATLLLHAGTPERTALVLSVPHGGRRFPARFRSRLTVDPDDLWSDWETDVLFDVGADLGMPTIVAGLSRFVADPNRDPAGCLHGSFWSTVVPASDPWGRPLYSAPIGAAELEDRIAAAHRTYHEALGRLVETSLEHRSRVLLLDLHSFGLPLDADVVIGDRHGTTARPETSVAVADAFSGAGFRVEQDTRFSGGRIVGRWQEDDRVDAVQIELNQRRYLLPEDVDEGRPHPRPGSGRPATRAALRVALRRLSQHVSGPGRRPEGP